MDELEFPRLIRDLYATVAALEKMFPGRHFTPDGHLVGSLGEALAAHYYGVTLAPASNAGFDGTCDGKQVEVKVTQGSTVSLSSYSEHLIVFKLLEDGTFEEHYNGPGKLAWELVSHRKPTKNGQWQVSLAALRRVMAGNVGSADRLEPVCTLPAGMRRHPCRA